MRCLGKRETGPSQASMGAPAKAAGVWGCGGLAYFSLHSDALPDTWMLGYLERHLTNCILSFWTQLNGHPKEHCLLLGHISVGQWSLFIYFILFFF